MATMTKGNVIVENIKVGDVHYEYEHGMGIKCEVITLPIRDDEGYWTWKSINLITGNLIDYGVREGMTNYSCNLYDYEVYKVDTWI